MPLRKALLPTMAFASVSLLAGASAWAQQASVTQWSITRSIMIRIPGWRRAPATPAAPGPQFKEHKGPRCIDAAAIGGAAISAPDSVDFILRTGARGGQRVRARLEEQCPSLDYYSGFYVVPPPDGKICADRDSIHTRSGGDCQVDKFRALTPLPPPPPPASQRP